MKKRRGGNCYATVVGGGQQHPVVAQGRFTADACMLPRTEYNNSLFYSPARLIAYEVYYVFLLFVNIHSSISPQNGSRNRIETGLN